MMYFQLELLDKFDFEYTKWLRSGKKIDHL